MQPIDGQPGFYTLPTDTGAMPFTPSELNVPRYLFPASYGRAEQEEAAARFVAICQEAGAWVGVSLPRFCEQMKKEFEQQQAQQEAISAAQQHNWAEQRRYNQWLPRYVVLCIFTLGLYALFGKKPSAMQPNLVEVPHYETPFSLTNLLGPQPVITGLAELAQRNMLRIERSEDGEFDVIFPTPSLLEPIARFRRS